MANSPETQVFDQFLSFMEEALSETTKSASQIDELKSRMKKLQDEQNKVVLEKVAAAKASFFNKTAMDNTLTKLRGMGIIDDGAMTKLSKRIMEDPNVVFPIMLKVAESVMTVPDEGSGVGPEDATGNIPKVDPDGWDEAAQGKPVAIRP